MSPVFRTLLLLVFTGFFYLPNANASLNGTYTIDPSQPVSKTNYKTIMAAVYDLCEGYRNDGGTSNGKGVNGAVVFNIAKGTYNEYIKITGILGAYSTNTVTFQSATGKAEDVLIQFESTDFYQVDQVLRLYGADNLIFKNLTFKHLGKTTYGCVIGLFYGADNNLFIGNNFIGRNIFSSSHPGSENAIVILANGAYNNTFTNNKFSYGTYAIYYESSIGYRINELTIKDNKFDSAYFGGLYLRNIDDLIIRNNKITNSKYDAAVDLKDCGRSLEFDGNTIYSNASTNGVLISGGKNFGLQAKIFNNFITAGRIALLVNSIKSAEIYFNNLLSLNTIDKIAALSLSLNGNAHLYNNNLIGHGTSYALQLSDTAKVISNYNNLFAQGNILVGIGTKWQTNLKSWINYSARDTHSLSTDPRFLSWTDLHIINPLLDKAGINILSVKNDIDGQVRANTKPDIGADEFTTYKDDVYLIPVDSLQPGTVCKAGLENLYVKFINLGSDTLKSLTFEWEFNSNKQNKIKWIGQLNPGDDTLIIVDTLRFTDRSNNVKIIAVLPNGQTDSNAVNNQVIYDNIYTALGGEILLGGTNPDYPTIQAAFDELHLRGVCGVTVLKLSDGEYKEQLKIKNIPGVSKTNTVTLTSESADSSKIIITYPTNKDEQNNYVLSLEGANYITLKSLTFTRTGNEVANDIISLSQGASNNNFISCQVFGRKYIQYKDENVYDWIKYSRCLVKNSKETEESGNVFRNNLFRYAYMGFDFPANTKIYEEESIIEGNIFDSCLFSAISINYQDGVKINNNIIENCLNGGISVSGLSWNENNYKVNYIQNNKVFLRKGAYGIRAYSDAIISNNEISIEAVPQKNSVPAALEVASFVNTEVYYNSVLVWGKPLPVSKAFSQIYSSIVKTVKVFNNSFMNLSDGKAGDFGNADSYLSSNNNNWYSTGKTIKLIGNYTTLKDWKAATGKDANSISLDAWYGSYSNLIIQNPLADNIVTPITGFTKDIKGKSRGTTKPDIGANEFSPSAYDAGISQITGLDATFCADKYPVSAYIRNYGSQALTNVRIDWTADYMSQTPASFSGTLNSGDSVLVNLGTADLSNSYKSKFGPIEAWTELLSDGNTKNDTSKFVVYGRLNGAYTIGKSNADYTSISNAGNDLQKRGMCGPVTFKIKDGTYTEQLALRAVKGSSSINMLTFESESGDSSKVIWQYPSTTEDLRNYIFSADSVMAITIKHITFKRTGYSKYGNAIKMINTAGYIVFSGNCIYGSLLPGTRIDDNHNTLLACYLKKDSLTRINLTHNSFYKGAVGALLAGYWTSNIIDSALVANNTIDSCADGLALLYIDKGFVQENYIRCSNTGLRLDQIKSKVIVQRNKIFILKQPGISYTYGLPIGVEGANFTGVFANNMVSVKDGDGVSGLGGSIYNNSILVYGKTNHTTLSIGAYNVYIANNNIVNLGPGLAFNALNKNNFTLFNYNNTFSAGINTARFYHYNSNSYLFSDEVYINSYSYPVVGNRYVNPFYRSVYDLRTKHAVLNGNGIFHAKEDIDFRLRDSLKPDIGMHEFDVHDTDVSMYSYSPNLENVCPNPAVKFTVEIVNNAQLDAKNIPLTAEIWDGNKMQLLHDTIRTVIAPYTAYKHTFKNSFSTASGSAYSFKIYTHLQGDEDRSDDTLKFINTLLSNPSTPKTDSVYIVCAQKTERIYPEKISEGDNLHWYANAITTKKAFDGDFIETGSFKNDTTVYVSASNAVSINAIKYEEAAAPSGYGTMFYLSNRVGYKILAHKEMTLESFTVHPKDSAKFKVKLYENSIKLIYEKEYVIKVNKTGEPVELLLGIKLPKGEYAATITDGAYGSLQYTFEWQEYIQENVVEILIENHINPFYNFKASVAACSESPRVPVYVKVIKPLNPVTTKGLIFQGTYNKGNIADPDLVCAGNAVSYNLSTDYDNAQYGKSWSYTSAVILDSAGNKISDTSWHLPTASNDAVFSYFPAFNASPGIYKLEFIAKTTFGCDTNLTRYIKVLPAVQKPSFTARNFCQADTTLFSIIGSINSGYNYTWRFGDGRTSVGSIGKNVYSKPGNYTVKLIVTNQSGCKDSVDTTIHIYGQPTARFNVKTKACLGDVITFTDSTLNPGNDSLIYVWQFGDSARSFIQNPQHSYTKSGNYNVKLTVITLGGCTSSALKSIVINDVPNATFTTNISNRIVTFIPADTTSSTYLWYFGDGDTSTNINPVYKYKNDSSYWVKLRVTNVHGCENTDSILITVKNVSVDQQPMLQKWIKVYPNPFSNHINLSLDIKQTGRLQIKLTDISGRVVTEKVWQNISAGICTEVIQTNNSHFVPGVYFLQIILGDEVITKQLIKVQ